MNLGFVCATHCEAKAIFKELDNIPHYKKNGFLFYEIKYNQKNKGNIIICISGVGPINATKCCATLIGQFHIDHIVNFGTCGAINSKLKSGCIVIPNHLLFIGRQSQVVAEMKFQNNARGLFNRQSAVSVWPIGLTGWEGTLATCSSFVSSVEKQKIVTMDIDAVDMEAFALAFTCNNNNTPLSMYKIVVDSTQSTINTIGNYLQLQAEILERYTDKLHALIRSICNCDINIGCNGV